MPPDYLLQSKPLNATDINQLLTRAANCGNQLALAVCHLGEAFDELTQGHGGYNNGTLDQQEELIRRSLPEGFRVTSTEAKLGEHQTRAIGSRIVEILSASGIEVRAEWKAAGTMITLKIHDRFTPEDYNLHHRFLDPELGDAYAFEAGGPPCIYVKIQKLDKD